MRVTKKALDILCALGPEEFPDDTPENFADF